MSLEVHGELVPVGGGDPIPLLRAKMTVGRRESCDICMKFPNVSGVHCELSFREGFWYVRDLGSTNGVKVNGVRVHKRPLNPSDEITIAKRTFRIEYTPPVGMQTLEEMLEDVDDTLAQSLLEKAGLARPQNLPQVRTDPKAKKKP